MGERRRCIRVESYTIADDPSTPAYYVIRDGRKYTIDGDPVEWREYLAPRAYGDGLPGATTMLRGAYELRGDAATRLLALLPPLAVIPATPQTRPALELLTAEVAREEPGQDAVLRPLASFTRTRLIAGRWPNWPRGQACPERPSPPASPSWSASRR